MIKVTVMKNLSYIALALLAGFITACASSDDTNYRPADPNRGTGVAPAVVSVTPSETKDVALTGQVVITYDKNIFLPPDVTIKVNGKYMAAEEVSASGQQLTIPVDMTGNTDYTIEVLKPTVRDENYNFAQDYTISFKTKAVNNFPAAGFDIAENLVTPGAMQQTVNLYNFLKENLGKNIITGAMADVNWNTGMADKMYEMAEKYPAINCFDFVHHIFSAPLNQQDWAPDYTDMTVVRDWWNNNGIPAFMWHWNVPINKMFARNFNRYAFYVNDASKANTTFDAEQATVPGTYENGIINRDLDIIADYFLALQAEGIPGIWRPLHEAAGNTNRYLDGKAWFWWGNKGAEAYKNLWIYMFEYFKQKGVKNLIWVWTSETDDPDWYPGDEYVDIIGTDYYENDESLYHTSIRDRMDAIMAISNKKMITLSECGAIPHIDNVLQGGDVWSWMMPWYGGYTTDATINSPTFFKEMFEHNNVITRDKMPSLK